MSLGAAAFLTAAAKPTREHSYSSVQRRINLLYNGATGLGGQLGVCHSRRRTATAQGLRGEPGAPPGATPKGAQEGWRKAQSKTPPVQIPAASRLRRLAKMHQSPAPKPSDLQPAKVRCCSWSSEHPWTAEHRSSHTQAVGPLPPGHTWQRVLAANTSCVAFHFSIATG